MRRRTSNRLNDPIEAIARASKVRHRKIVLGPNWWKRDIRTGDRVHGEDRRPVALLPSGTKYEVVDPSKRVRELLTEAAMEELHPDGYVIRRRTVKDLLSFGLHGKARTSRSSASWRCARRRWA